MGGALGTAVFLSILFSAAPSKIAERFQAAGVRPPTGSVDLNDTSNLKRLPSAVQEPILAGFSDAMSVVFLVGACVLVIAFVLSIMMKEVPLRQMSGIEQAARTRRPRLRRLHRRMGRRQRCRTGRRPRRPMAGARPGYPATTAPLRLRGHPLDSAINEGLRSGARPESAEPLDRGLPQ